MKRLFLSPKEISSELVQICIRKAQASLFELFLFEILAGIYIGFGAQTALTILSGSTLDPGFARFLAGSVFSVGLMLVLIPGAELFTGNILMTIGLIDKKYGSMKMLRNWCVVYIGNFIGSVLLACIVFKSGLMGSIATGLSPVGNIAVKIAETKLSLSFTEGFTRGILCNMLVCLGVIMCISSLTITGKIFGIYFPIMAFVACGYEHSIANMFFIPAGMMVKCDLYSGFVLLWKNLIPVTFGNIVGGVLLVFFHPKMEQKLFNYRPDRNILA
ncbi:MAG: formate/nitrite transporter family protein [Candidatus Ratteibacteria bacterium]